MGNICSTKRLASQPSSHSYSKQIIGPNFCRRTQNKTSVLADRGFVFRHIVFYSFLSSNSLTICGLALPLDSFITWPTNQPRKATLPLR